MAAAKYWRTESQPDIQNIISRDRKSATQWHMLCLEINTFLKAFYFIHCDAGLIRPLRPVSGNESLSGLWP